MRDYLKMLLRLTQKILTSLFTHSTKEKQLLFQLFLLTLLALAAADSKILEPRIEKSLVNTFPFDVNEGEHGDDHHDHHDGHHDHHGHDENQKTSSSLVHPLLGRQYGPDPPEDPPKKCVQKEN